MGDSQSANGPGLFLPTNENVTFIRKKKKYLGGGGGGRNSSVGRASESWWGGRGIDSRCGRLLPTGWVSVSIM